MDRNEINFQDNNHLSDERRNDWSHTQWIDEFYRFLQGENPEGVEVTGHRQIKLSQKKAYTVIWYLQEHLRILPDHIERCDNCGELYDSHSGGIYWESKGKFFCGGCEYLVPENYDRGKK